MISQRMWVSNFIAQIPSMLAIFVNLFTLGCIYEYDLYTLSQLDLCSI